MASSMLVLHFGHQCPWVQWVVRQSRQASARLGYDLQVVDVQRFPDYALRYRLFFPFMVVINNEIRVLSPTPACELVRLAHLEPASASPKTHIQQPVGTAEYTRPLLAADIALTCWLCILPPDGRGCKAKSTWAARLGLQISRGILGFAAYQGEQVVGALEFIPSQLSPYPLPEKEADIAFITCLYSMEDGHDFRLDPLHALIEHASNSGFKRLHVISGRNLPYPNGPQAFFSERGFRELGILDEVLLGNDRDSLVLMELHI